MEEEIGIKLKKEDMVDFIVFFDLFIGYWIFFFFVIKVIFFFMFYNVCVIWLVVVFLFGVYLV